MESIVIRNHFVIGIFDSGLGGLTVVACNTVSSLALDIVKKHSNVPVFGVVEPAIKKALELTNNNKIGLIGTRATVNSNAYKKVTLRKHASILVPLIEEGFINGPELDLFIARYLAGFIAKVDTLILGCTHYSIIKDQISKYLGKKITLVDPAEEVAKVVYKFIQKQSIYSKKPRSDFYYLTDVNERFMNTAKMFLGYDISNKTEKVSI